MKKNIFTIGLCTAALMLASASCSKDNEVEELLSGTSSIGTKAVVIRDSLTVETDTVGILKEKIGDRASSLQKLIISGPINATDVSTIRSMENLLALNLKEATICGGDSTYTYGNTQYRLYNNIIGQYMFSRTNLSEIVLPDNITEIEENAFRGLNGSENYFESIAIPEGVIRIGESAFYECRYLKNVSLPSSLKVINSRTFWRCYDLQNIELGGVEEIGQNAFSECSNLQNINLSNIKILRSGCFSNSGLISVVIPEGIIFETTSQDSNINQSFSNCTSLHEVSLPSGMTEIPGGIFDGCTALTTINVPESVTHIRESAFEDCTSLSEIALNNGLTELGNRTFYGCEKLNNITLPETLTNIGNSVFYECTALTSIVIPNNVNNIGTYCFHGCSALTSVTLSEILTAIPEGAFAYCTHLENLTLPNQIEIIDEGAFRGCTNITTLELPASLKQIDYYAFQNSGLSEITLNEGIETLSNYAFYECKELKLINISNSVTYIGSHCFGGCISLGSITIPNSVSTIGSYCFETCTALSDITLPDNLRTIEQSAFSGCTNLTTITIPESVTSVANNIFHYCENLTSIFWNTNTAVPTLFSANSNTSSYFNRNPYCLLYLKHADTPVNDTNIKNIIVDGIASEIVLSSEMGNFHVPQEFKANRLVYTRDFTYPTVPGQASGWRSISLPFTVQSITGPNGETLAPFNADVAGAKPFWLRRLTANGFENVTEIEAGVPYIIAMPNNEAYDDEYNISGTVTFTAESGSGIAIPATAPENKIQDIGPQFGFTCNYNYHTANTVIWALNENASDSRLAGSVFVRNERAVMPFEGYVATSASTPANAPAYFSIGSSTPITRGTKPLGPVPSIDDM